ncbi:hypothetical protein GMRT_15777 [Giardia muris]|uniref:Uncharacterized protein n=1 Tax=Giardia muris TaxID=5742 RepID=A0A4Z1T9D4_GIAMU|nr:hypothetical protein GMRT_15777 [Giardia muris]|eukprot:TNJ29131.1 hypothetical protein GMRT_15777 [Giardia muris]
MSFQSDTHNLAFFDEGQFLSGFQGVVARAEQFLYLAPLAERLTLITGKLRQLSSSQSSALEIGQLAEQMRTGVQKIRTDVSALLEAVQCESNSLSIRATEYSSLGAARERLKETRRLLVDIKGCVSALAALARLVETNQAFRREFNEAIMYLDTQPSPGTEGTFLYRAQTITEPDASVKQVVGALFEIEQARLHTLESLVVHSLFQRQLSRYKRVIYEELLLPSINAWLSEVRKSAIPLGQQMMSIAQDELNSTCKDLGALLRQILNLDDNKAVELPVVLIQSQGLMRVESDLSYVREFLAITDMLGFKDEAIIYVQQVRRKQAPSSRPSTEQEYGMLSYGEYIACLAEGTPYKKLYEFLGYFLLSDLIAEVTPAVARHDDTACSSLFTEVLKHFCDDYCRNPSPHFVADMHKVIACIHSLSSFSQADEVTTYFTTHCLATHCQSAQALYLPDIMGIIEGKEPYFEFLGASTETADTLLGRLADCSQDTLDGALVDLQRYLVTEGLRFMAESSSILCSYVFDILSFHYPLCYEIVSMKSDKGDLLQFVVSFGVKEVEAPRTVSLSCIQSRVNLNILIDKLVEFILISFAPHLIAAIQKTSEISVVHLLRSYYIIHAFSLALQITAQLSFALFGLTLTTEPFTHITASLYSSIFTGAAVALPEYASTCLGIFAKGGTLAHWDPINLPRTIGPLHQDIVARYNADVPVVDPTFGVQQKASMLLRIISAGLAFLPTEFGTKLDGSVSSSIIDTWLRLVSNAPQLSMPAAGGLATLVQDLRLLASIQPGQRQEFGGNADSFIGAIRRELHISSDTSTHVPGYTVYEAFIRSIVGISQRTLHAPFSLFHLSSLNTSVMDSLNGAIADLTVWLSVLTADMQVIDLLAAVQSDNPAALPVIYQSMQSIQMERPSGNIERENRLIAMCRVNCQALRSFQLNVSKDAARHYTHPSAATIQISSSSMSASTPTTTATPTMAMTQPPPGSYQTPQATPTTGKLKSIFSRKPGKKV